MIQLEKSAFDFEVAEKSTVITVFHMSITKFNQGSTDFILEFLFDCRNLPAFP